MKNHKIFLDLLFSPDGKRKTALTIAQAVIKGINISPDGKKELAQELADSIPYYDMESRKKIGKAIKILGN